MTQSVLILAHMRTVNSGTDSGMRLAMLPANYAVGGAVAVLEALGNLGRSLARWRTHGGAQAAETAVVKLPLDGAAVHKLHLRMKDCVEMMGIGLGTEKRRKDTVAENTTSETPGQATAAKQLGDVRSAPALSASTSCNAGHGAKNS